MRQKYNTMKSQGTSKAGEMDWEEQLEEYGDLHHDLCPCVNDNNPDGCECDMHGLKTLFRQAINQAIAQERKRIVGGHVLSQDNDVVGGKIRFAGTRIPVQLVAEYEAKGHSLDEIINDCFPSLKDLHIITNNHE